MLHFEKGQIHQDSGCCVKTVQAKDLLWEQSWNSIPPVKSASQLHLCYNTEDGAFEPLRNEYFFLLYVQFAKACKSTVLYSMLLSAEGPAGKLVLCSTDTKQAGIFSQNNAKVDKWKHNVNGSCRPHLSTCLSSVIIKQCVKMRKTLFSLCCSPCFSYILVPGRDWPNRPPFWLCAVCLIVTALQKQIKAGFSSSSSLKWVTSSIKASSAGNVLLSTTYRWLLHDCPL